MAVTRKASFEDLQNAVNNSYTGTPAEETPKKKTPAPDEEKIKITFFMNKSTKETLKNYCDKNDMTLTAGIKKAIREMLKNESY